MAVDGESVSLEPDSLEPVPVASGRAIQQQGQSMGAVWSRSPVPEETEVDGDDDDEPSQVAAASIDGRELNRSVPWTEVRPDDVIDAVDEVDERQEERDEADEAPQQPEPVEYVTEDGVHFMHDGHYWHEMPGLPPAEEDTSVVVETARNIRVRFSTGPIRGNQSVE